MLASRKRLARMCTDSNDRVLFSHFPPSLRVSFFWEAPPPPLNSKLFRGPLLFGFLCSQLGPEERLLLECLRDPQDLRPWSALSASGFPVLACRLC